MKVPDARPIFKKKRKKKDRFRTEVLRSFGRIRCIG